MNKVFLFLSALCFTAFYSTFAVAAYATEEYDLNSLPLAQDIGIDLSVPLAPEEMTGVITNKEKTGDEEIQLAHGGCGYGHVDCLPLPPLPLYLGNVCRAGISFCYTPAPDIVGTICHCIGYNFWGFPYIRFHGAVSQY